MEIQYSDAFIDRLHLVWGPGFLSPGGPEEVRRIVCGLALDDARVLDIGCGAGGPAVVLARDMGARLVCVDIEQPLLDRAQRLAAEAGVGDRIEFRLVTPGPLPFDAAAFDVVFSKDALIHVADKAALYAETLRVLKPGGTFAASDWLTGGDAAGKQALQRFLDRAPLNFVMATAEEAAALMRAAGFTAVETDDRNAWYADIVTQELAAIDGPLRQAIIAITDEEAYEAWRDTRRCLADAVRSGSLRPTHLRGLRPRD